MSLFVCSHPLFVQLIINSSSSDCCISLLLYYYYRGYLLRFAKSTKRPGDVVFIISADWFKSWIEYTGYQVRSLTPWITDQTI